MTADSFSDFELSGFAAATAGCWSGNANANASGGGGGNSNTAYLAAIMLWSKENGNKKALAEAAAVVNTKCFRVASQKRKKLG